MLDKGAQQSLVAALEGQNKKDELAKLQKLLEK